jgi:anti-sigma factor RsiW
MTHDEVEQQEIVERYVRKRLSPEDRGAFQEHFFACDSCFDQIQTMERFIASVQHAAETGVLVARPDDRHVPTRGASGWLGSAWIKPLFAATAAVAVALLFWAGWLSLYRLPHLRTEMANERAAREEIDKQREQEMNRALEQLESERAERTRIEGELNKRQQVVAALVQPNVPLVMLEGTRDSQAANVLDLPARTGNFVLWLEAEPEGRFRNFRLQIYTADKKLAQTVTGLRRNAYGAVAVSLPAAAFQTGKYLVGLYGVGARDSELVGEHTLQIRKH